MAKRATAIASVLPHIPKNMPLDLSGMHPDDMQKLESVAASKIKKAVPRPLPSLRDGDPTRERLARAHNHFHIGDDKQGGRIYQFHDSTMDRLYSRLTRAAGRRDEELLRSEYIALQKYKHHWFAAGLQSALGSADLNRVFASDPGSMSGMAKTEKQAHHRQQYRAARELLGHKPGIVVDNVVCAETSLEVAGWSIGVFTSRTSARDGAEKIVRESGRALAKLWGIG